ncbi:Hypothetical protein SMAX5B_012989 [Scophthalmus maximus]|uniref:Uncharacterized protein n=1 Tax=Scophthalmus maximus TaxID=52904 RepID=A0A2U9BMY2_SCOMX|nr:Hypothetical protein SMAX5B_012989 [Scophthalmus maximus]
MGEHEVGHSFIASTFRRAHLAPQTQTIGTATAAVRSLLHGRPAGKGGGFITARRGRTTPR